MPRKKVDPGLTKWGFPKNVVVSAFGKDVPKEAIAWATTRDEIDAQLLDLLDALEAGVIDRGEYQRLKAPLLSQMKRAVSEWEKALRRKAKPSKSN